MYEQIMPLSSVFCFPFYVVFGTTIRPHALMKFLQSCRKKLYIKKEVVVYF